MNRASVAGLLLVVVCGGVLSVLAEQQPAVPPVKATEPRVLPGVLPTGEVQLANQWRLRPTGKHVTLGDFPVNLAIHPSGEWLVALHAGYGEHELVVLHLPRQKIVSRATIDQAFYGLCFSADGKQIYASGGEYEVVHAFDFQDGYLSQHKQIRVAPVAEKFIPGGLTVHPSGSHLYVPGTWGDAVRVVPLATPEKRETLALEKGAFPYACLLDAQAKKLYVSQWGLASIAVIDLAAKKVLTTWATEKHPTELLLSPNEDLLYVACANSTKVSVLSTADGKATETLTCSLYPNAPVGNTPNSLSRTKDGQLLFVANADNNNVAVFNVAEKGRARSLGFIPVGWYPTSVRWNEKDKKLYVANGKGTTPLANPQGPQPELPRNATVRQYIASLYRGTLAIIDEPTPERLGRWTPQALACSPLRPDQSVVGKIPDLSPIPKKVGEPSPIKHCIYIIKENRTYDQVFGDMKEGNGDKNLCLFPEKITPNHHKLAREFVLLDNFYVDGEVSADGHEWSMGAYASDYVEKVWPLSYRGSPFKKFTYPSEGNYPTISPPAGGYLWTRCAQAKVSYRSYGEWIDNGKTVNDPGKPRDKLLEGHFDPHFRGYDLDYPDQKRADRFIAELQRFEKEGGFPQLSILRLPNDHTFGTRPGKLTPTAMVADNDLALGRVVEAVSQSKFWNETAIFVIEDDAQNGPDHVDAHRCVALVISPYTKNKHVDSTLYSTSSMLRTMELILGLQPMSQYDAAARPMYESFQPTANSKPYKHVVPDTDLNAKNGDDAPGAALSLQLELEEKEDAADDILFNRVIWQSVKGAQSEMPAPVRAGFFFSKP